MKKFGSYLVLIAGILTTIFGIYFVLGKPIANQLPSVTLSWFALILGILTLIFGWRLLKLGYARCAFLALVAGIIGLFLHSKWYGFAMVLAIIGGLLGLFDKGEKSNS